MNYPSVLVGKIAKVTGGFAFKSGDFTTSGVPVLKIKNVRSEGVDMTETDFVSNELADQTSSYDCKYNDILVSMTGSGPQAPDSVVGRIARFSLHGTRPLINQRVGRLRVVDQQLFDQRFLYFALKNPNVSQGWLHQATGSANQANISLKQIESTSVPNPPLREQKQIAAILGSLDDKIELNRRMNETLEEMARAIFRSWFVDFDPVRIKARGGDLVKELGISSEIANLFPDSFEDSELGKIPKGWRASVVGELIEINPKCRLKQGEIAPYIDMKNLPTSGHAIGDVTCRATLSGAKFQNGDTLVARITPCLENGKTAFVDVLEDDQVGWGSTEFIVLRSKLEIPKEFSYLLARDPQFREYLEVHMTGSSGRQRVPNDIPGEFRIAKPPSSLYNALGTSIQAIFGLMSSNSKESKTLEELRNFLLPNLINGEVQIG